MKCSILISIIILCLSGPGQAADRPGTLDSSTAFYAGDSLNYVISPPDGFQMIVGLAADDGYSFAFISRDETYDSASIIIGVNIFKVEVDSTGGTDLNLLIESDTTALRLHYGESLEVSEVEPIKTEQSRLLRTIYINDRTRLIPNVMMSYFDGGKELLIFDLSVAERFPRYLAEKVYLNGLKKFKALIKGELEASETE